MPFAQEMAAYVQALLEDRESAPSAGQTFISNLLPFLKETLQAKPPRLIYGPREVYVPEMGAQYAAFPDLTKHAGYYYAAFREGRCHVAYGDLGRIRLLRGSYQPETQQWQWYSIACLASPAYDLRDPKFFVDANGNLKMMVGGSVIDKQETTIKMVPHIAASINGQWKIEPTQPTFPPLLSTAHSLLFSPPPQASRQRPQEWLETVVPAWVPSSGCPATRPPSTSGS
jgi:hypothetical protein